MIKHRILETERLLLTSTHVDDSAFILELLNTPKWLKQIGDRQVRTLEDAKAYIKNTMRPQLERLGYSTYTLIRKSDQSKIGICGLYDREGLEGIDIGFACLPEFEKQGYIFEAAQKVKQLAFTAFNITELRAITSKENVASQKLLEKLGLELTGSTKLPDDDEEVLVYEMIKSAKDSL